MRDLPTAPMTDPYRLIRTPLGLPGSGRTRYGAAMALFARGLLGEAALEVYRICSPLDGQDPAPLLVERGLLPLPISASSGATRLARLLAEADGYLARLPGPGVTEVRHGLARAVATADPAPAAPNAVVERCLSPALRDLSRTHPSLAASMAAAASYLRWITYDGYRRDAIGAAFADGHAFASIVGAGAPFEAGDFDFGLFLIAPHVLYRDHAHPAPELYAPLTGPHGWRFGPDAPLVVMPAHVPVWNAPGAPHLTKVGARPFLCFYGWTRDVDDPAHVVPATDWSALEALRL